MTTDSRGEARQEMANVIRPAVIVGLGGTGKEVVALIREYLIEQYGSLGNIPIVSFVVIDTDPAQAEAESRSANARQIRLDADESVFASIPDIGTIWRERENLPHLRNWLPPDLDGIGDVSQGAKQIRALGRLAFFSNFADIIAALRNARAKVINPDHAATLADREIEIDPKFQTRPEYYLVASLCGGTGAGMFLDTAFVIKHIEAARGKSPVIAYLAMPDVFADKSVGRVNPNAYAALKELNYFTYNARDRKGEYLDPRYRGNRPWKVQYAEGATEIEADPPPFQYCYLVGMQNDDATVEFTPETRTDFFEMLAHNIVLDFTSDFGTYKRSARDNPGEGFLEPDTRGLPQSFCSFGLSSLRFPRKAVLNACALRLAESAIRLWRGQLAGEPTQHLIDSAVVQFLEEDMRLGERAGSDVIQVMARWLGNAGEGGSLFGQLDGWRRKISDRVLRERPGPAEIRSMLGSATTELQEGVYDDGSADVSRWGPWLRTMHGNMEEQLGQCRDELEAKVEDLLNADYGVAAVQEFLERLARRLETMRSDLDRQLEDDSQLRSQSEQSRKRMDRQLHRIETIASTFVFDKSRVLAIEADDYLAITSRSYQDQLGRKAAELGARLMSGLLAHVAKLERDLEELDALLTDLQGRFHASYEDWAARASSQMVNGISLYEHGDTIAKCYEIDVPREQEVGIARTLSKAVLDGFDTGLLGITRVPRIDLREALFERAAEDHFPHLEDISAAEILAGKSEVEMERLLRAVHGRSSPFIHLIRHTPGFYPENIIRNHFVGILGGERSGDQYVQQVLPYLRELPGLRGNIHPLPESAKDEILIGQELYTFPLRAVGGMEGLQADYKRYLRQGKRLPVHICRGWEEILPDHVPVAVEIEQEARLTAAVGLGLALITPGDSGTGWMYEYIGEAGVPEPVSLTDEQEFSLLWRRLAEDPQVRQRLNQDIETVVSQSETEEARRALHTRLSAYLQQLAERYGPTSMLYQEQHSQIVTFINERGLAPEN